MDALVDLPFALPTAVAGIALTAAVCAERLDRVVARAARHPGRLHAARHRRRADVHRPAVRGAHGAAGAGRTSSTNRKKRPTCSAPARWQTFRRVILPALLPALLTGFALAFARGAGRIRLGDLHRRQHADDVGNRAAADRDRARAVQLCRRHGAGPVMLLVSFLLLLAINRLQHWMRERHGD